MTNDKSQILPKTERTPGPWYVKDNTVLCQQDNIIAECPKYGCSILCEGEIAPQHRAKENAAFIVKACNLHDELVDALTWLVRCADPNDDDEGFNNWKIQDIEHAVNRAKDLIAKAQEV